MNRSDYVALMERIATLERRVAELEAANERPKTLTLPKQNGTPARA